MDLKVISAWQSLDSNSRSVVYNKYLKAKKCECKELNLFVDKKEEPNAAINVELDNVQNLLRENKICDAVKVLRKILKKFPDSRLPLVLFHQMFMHNNNEKVLFMSKMDQSELVSLLESDFSIKNTGFSLAYQELSQYALANTYIALNEHKKAHEVFEKIIRIPCSKLMLTNQNWQNVHENASVVVMTVASEERQELQNLRKSAKVSGVELIVLGLNREYMANGQKAILYLEGLKQLPKDQVVVCVDAYDVLISPNIRRIPYLLSKSSAPILFSSEMSCYPDPGVSHLYPTFDINFDNGAFSNAGSFAGLVEDLIDMLQVVCMYPSMPTTCDQRAMTKFYLEHPGRVTLDYKQEMFATLAMKSSPIKFHADGTFELLEYNVYPGVLHANANWGKIFYPDLIKSWISASQLNRSIGASPPSQFSGLALAKLGRKLEAIMKFRDAIKTDPDDADSYYNLGILLREVGDLEGEKLAYFGALDVNAQLIMSLNNLALLLYNNGEVDKSVDMLQKAYEIESVDHRKVLLATVIQAKKEGKKLNIIYS